jgi:hypothetical protein
VFDSLVRRYDQRPLGKVPPLAWCILAAALLGQISWSTHAPRQAPTATDLAAPPSRRAAIAMSLGDPLAAAKVMNLVLQAHDNQPGLPVPFARLDYAVVKRWLERILELDPHGPYPLLAASRLYGEVHDPQRQRIMLDFVHEKFHEDPNRRWPALAHAAHVARHGLKDMALARTYAASLRREATAATVPGWAKQMEILLLADMDEVDAARVLLGALLENGQIADPAEARFLASRLPAPAHPPGIPEKP